MTPSQPESDNFTPPDDDRIIGRVFWKSVVVAATGATVFAIIAFWPQRPPLAPVVAELPVGPALVPLAPELPALKFADVTEQWGINFLRTTVADGRTLLPETMGGGVAVADADADGDLDLLFVDGDAWSDRPLQEGDTSSSKVVRGVGIALYLNRGQATASGQPRFSVARNTGLTTPWQGMGIAVADLNGDQRPEILATGVPGVRFFVANPATPGEAPSWRDATAESGLSTVHGWTTAAGFADFDQDGDLDLLIARYVEWSAAIDERVNSTISGLGRAYGAPTGFAGTEISYFEQVAPLSFVDRSKERGLCVTNPATRQPMAKALGFTVEDCDNDGDLDIFVANDTVQNFLFINDGKGNFVEQGVSAGIAFDRNGAATGAMGCDASHLRNDSSLAIAVGNFANDPCSLYVTPGTGRFNDDSIVDGISAATRHALTFGTVFADLDADGREDLIFANGHIEPRIARVQPSQAYEQSAQVFWNSGSKGAKLFHEIPGTILGALARPVVGRGLAWGDLDDDGALDLVIATVSGSPLVVRNESAVGRSIAITLDDSTTAGNRAALGAQLTAVLSDGQRLQRTVMPTRSYLSQVPPVAWIGLGRAPISSLEVRWPDGVRETLSSPGFTGSHARMVVRRKATEGSAIEVLPSPRN